MQSMRTPCFSAPKGIRGIATQIQFWQGERLTNGFSAPKGIRGIATTYTQEVIETIYSKVSVPRRALEVLLHSVVPFARTPGDPVSVPRRALEVLLPLFSLPVSSAWLPKLTMWPISADFASVLALPGASGRKRPSRLLEKYGRCSFFS